MSTGLSLLGLVATRILTVSLIVQNARDPAWLHDTSACPADIKLTVVYSAFVWPDNDWRMIITGQLIQLVDTGLLQCADMHVALTAPASHPNTTFSELEDLLTEATALIHSIPSGSRIRVVAILENAWEYYGIRNLWQLSMNDNSNVAQQHILLYFHTKGMVFHGRLQSRHEEDIDLTQRTIEPWRLITRKFAADRSISMVGKYPESEQPEDPGRWIWTNFFWVRSSYVQTCEEPARQPCCDVQSLNERYYFEKWLQTGNRTGMRTFSLCTCTFHDFGRDCVHDIGEASKCWS